MALVIVEVGVPSGTVMSNDAIRVAASRRTEASACSIKRRALSVVNVAATFATGTLVVFAITASNAPLTAGSAAIACASAKVPKLTDMAVLTMVVAGIAAVEVVGPLLFPAVVVTLPLLVVPTTMVETVVLPLPVVLPPVATVVLLSPPAVPLTAVVLVTPLTAVVVFMLVLMLVFMLFPRPMRCKKMAPSMVAAAIELLKERRVRMPRFLLYFPVGMNTGSRKEALPA